jgi:hypothetical protein
MGRKRNINEERMEKIVIYENMKKWHENRG